MPTKSNVADYSVIINVITSILFLWTLILLYNFGVFFFYELNNDFGILRMHKNKANLSTFPACSSFKSYSYRLTSHLTGRYWEHFSINSIDAKQNIISENNDKFQFNIFSNWVEFVRVFKYTFYFVN